MNSGVLLLDAGNTRLKWAVVDSTRAQTKSSEAGLSDSAMWLGQGAVAYHELASVKAFAEGAKEAFDRSWYWSSTQHAEHADYAWNQSFGNGLQYYRHKSNEWRARAVRTIKL